MSAKCQKRTFVWASATSALAPEGDIHSGGAVRQLPIIVVEVLERTPPAHSIQVVA
jgi:hypothetical protein